MRSTLYNDLLLLLAAAVWGFAFVAQRLGMEHLGPFTFNGIRFAIGALALLPFHLLLRRKSPAATLPAFPARGLILGLVLFAGASLQQVGIVTSTAGKAGFITGRYVVIVALLGRFFGRKTARSTWLGVVLALPGLYLLSVRGSLNLASGDALIFFGAWFWALHVLLIGKWSSASSVLGLAIVQYASVSVLSFGVAVTRESLQVASILAALGPLLYAGLLSTALAYTLQLLAQRKAPPAHAAVLLSLEAVFAVIGGIWLLGETLDARAILGSALMMTGMLASQLGQREA